MQATQIDKSASSVSADAGTEQRTPPYIPAAPNDSQRYFRRKGDCGHSMRVGDNFTMLTVFRFSSEEYARLQIEIRSQNGSTSTTTNLSADQLRDVASRMLDAAHEIETHPANQLLWMAA